MGIFDLFKFKKKRKPTEFVCSTCGKVHSELPALGFGSPHYYNELNETDKKEIAELTDDFCVITYEGQIDRFIRTTLSIPINHECQELDYGVWVSLSEKSFDEYKAEFNNNVEGKTYFGRISNKIADYDESTLGLHVNVNTRANGKRPYITVHRVEHELISDLENGISMNEAEKRIEKLKKTLHNTSPDKPSEG